MSDFDPGLLNIFAAEQGEHLQQMRASVDRLAGASTEEAAALYANVLHRAHTLKGAARAVGLDATERVIHLLETVCTHLRTREGEREPGEADTLHAVFDFSEDVLAWALGQRTRPEETGMLRRLQSLMGGSVTDGEPDTSTAASVDPLPNLPREDAPAELVRVDVRLLDAVSRVSAQLVNRAASEASQAERFEEFARFTDETLREYQRLRRGASTYLRRHQDDPDFGPVAACLSYLDQRRAELSSGTRVAASSQRQAAWELQQQVEELHTKVSQAQMIPADAAFGAFGAMVRSLAEGEGKHVNFRVEGLDVRADRLVLQALKEPVMHVLRNACSHGVEGPDERAASGKPEAGTVWLTIRSRGDRLTVLVEDDGAGLDTNKLAAEALRRGVMTLSRLNAMSVDEKIGLIFHPGLSTSGAVSNVAGRGMGLAIVREAVARLRGRITVSRRASGGTTVLISVPLSISTQQVLLVEEGEHVFAISAAQVEAVGRWRRERIALVNGRECIEYEEQSVPILGLAELLELGAHGAEDADTVQAVIVREASGRAAIAVGRILEIREATVRDTGLSAAMAGWSVGAVPLEQGPVAVLLNLEEPLRRVLATPVAASRLKPAEGETRRRRILVVDDSITTRSVERSILEAHGYEVELAVDGLDAWEKIRARLPELVISDVSMPRMTGFELLGNIKANPATAATPVILVTSLDSASDQEKGLSLGADAYIVKSKFDQRELLATVRQIL